MSTTEICTIEKLKSVLETHQDVKENLSREELITKAVEKNEAIVTPNGALATWTPCNSTGRSPKDTYIVKNPESESNIDWTSPNNIGLDPKTFELIFEDALKTIKSKKTIFTTTRVIGADSHYALPVRTISDDALSQVFVDNMFRPIPKDIKNSVFADQEFQLIAFPNDDLDTDRYKGLLRKLPNGETSGLCVVTDMDKKIGIIFGSQYQGSIKKMMFTAMNYLLPFHGVLPLHSSANEGKRKDSALLLGLSGTGKTTLSADPHRALLGDDEHGWSNKGIFNFENGCYAKMVDMERENEPEIWDAVMHNADYKKHGAILENAMIYPNGKIDFFDTRYTPNSRASYPLRFLSNIKPESTANHPKTILFLTADAYGVLPPVSKLSKEQAMLWFLMGYTSKLAGTETGVTEPQATFSRFFGQPFMPCNPNIYAHMLGDKMDKHNTNVFLINTGWSGGSYGTGSRIKLKYTRAMVDAALDGELDKVEFVEDKLFHVNIPVTCPNVPTEMLIPINTWEDKKAYKVTAEKLAEKFTENFDKAYGKQNISAKVIAQCPGK
ncbi:phosphoenolpyruvate carboxykinase (ATP) [Ancylomarina sp. 16SWW S1-10-2]|uniref:phosphoenolpyruvate carboxykinase (ATP) n=1 Tax=Ancylomarina sp. 16SWW S1-10-2 TaxID=2499681 RepID=UPI0012AE4D83|nr:phosphoenolpyruvate carboxykinase (ATP) [Ancylomarina sp. 16SWW S1-10-2]MRT94104.1 phosphoenolpyruvate carboxykinase (ATP) [Ancylomarina sp. 16SWW S1-10-2]